jgi:UDP:flavonoid glycosyltransferase YjiC (YdhE family)
VKTTSEPTPTAAPLRVALGSFGEAGHTFPVLAVAVALKARGHEVMVHTWHRWQDDIEAAGLLFAKAPQYERDPGTGDYLPPYEAVRRAVLDSEQDFRDFRPDVVISDVLSNTSALIAERIGVPSVTLVPHVYPISDPGMSAYSAGMRNPRTAAGKWFWGRFNRLLDRGYRQGEQEYEELRASLDLPPTVGPMPTLSRTLTLVATLPQLEYPRAWPDWVKVTGPLFWEPGHELTELPEGDDPLVLVAPSTSKDPDQRMLRAAMRGLAGEKVRVLGTTNRRPVYLPLTVGRQSRLVPWVSYSQVMPGADVVICNGGHGTVVRAIAAGCAVIVVPDDGDQRENAMRVAYAGAGLRIPRRWTSASSLRLATRRLLSDDRFLARARELQAWTLANPGDVKAAQLVEALVAEQRAAALSEAPA